MEAKIVFITGASSGIGEGCARKFAREGWNLILNARTVSKLEELKAAIRPTTILISVMYANNEIGTIQPIKKSAANVAMNKKNAPFPSATQSEYKQMIDFLEERPEKTPTAEAAKSEEKSE